MRSSMKLKFALIGRRLKFLTEITAFLFQLWKHTTGQNKKRNPFRLDSVVSIKLLLPPFLFLAGS